MSKRINVLISLLALLVLGACRDDEPSRSVDEGEPFFRLSTVELRVPRAEHTRTLYLGRGFNLLHYRLGEERGITTSSILDMERVRLRQPKASWGEDLSVYAPTLSIDNEWSHMDVIHGSMMDVTDTYTQDEIDVAVNEHFYDRARIPFRYIDSKREEADVYHARIYSYKVDQHIRLLADSSKDYRYYLRSRFLSHLRTMSGEELVKTYGTHLITQYNFGAFMDYVVSGKSQVFSREDVVTLASQTFEMQNDDLPAVKKATTYPNHIITAYKQGGSSYEPVPNLANFMPLFFGIRPKHLDYKAWQEGMSPTKASYLSLPLNKEGMIPIPDLIPDLSLKVKYTSAIIHTANPDKHIVYLLCEPRNYEAVKHKDKYLYVSLKKYESGTFPIYFNDDASKAFSEKELTGSGSDARSWRLEMDHDGRWKIYRSDIKKYLCTDLTLRTAEDAPEYLKYWLLNPIVPKPGANPMAWSNRLIKQSLALDDSPETSTL